MRINVRANNPFEEYNYLIYLYSKKKILKKQGHKVFIPQDEYFQGLWFSEVPYENFIFTKKEFGDKFYNEDVFLDKINEVKNNLDKINLGLSRIKELKIKDFKEFEEYNILYTAYGMGGSYDFKSGNVIILLNNFKNIIHTIVHEIIHIGIEESWVKKLKLSHWEKEALVDGICKKYFSDILVDYKIKTNINQEIFELVIKNDLDELYQKLKYYKNNF